MNVIQRNIALAKTELAYRYFKIRAHEKSKSKIVLDERLRDAFETIKKNGVAVVEDYYSAEKCALLCNEIDRLIEKYKEKIWTDKQQSDHRIFGAEKFSSLIHEFGYDKSISDFGEKYLETEMKLTMTLAARLDYVPGNLGSGGGWHRDSVQFNEFKSILYLSDVSDVNGPFTYVHGSHRQDVVKETVRKTGAHYDQYRFSEEQVKLMIKQLGLTPQTFTANKGTLILVDTRGIHIGSPIQEGNRHALTNYFSPAFRYDKMMVHANKVILQADK